MKFRKKPVVIEAVQWDGTFLGMRALELAIPTLNTLGANYHADNNTVHYWKIGTLEGGHEVSAGDWIITGVKGEHYPCKPEIFALSYEPAGQNPPAAQPTGRALSAAESHRAVTVAWESLLNDYEGSVPDGASDLMERIEAAERALLAASAQPRAPVAEQMRQDRNVAVDAALSAHDTLRNVSNQLHAIAEGMLRSSPPTSAQPTDQPADRDAYEGCREDLLDWKRRALAASAQPAESVQTAAVRDVLAERRRQVDVEGYDSLHDDEHDNFALCRAAAAYCMAASGAWRASGVTNMRAPMYWPWEDADWKPSYGRRDFVKAGALILAQIERHDRHAPSPTQGKEGV